MLFLQTFHLAHEIFTYTLRTRDITRDLDLPEAFRYMKMLGYRISRFLGQRLDVEAFFKAMTERFGFTETAGFLVTHREQLLWEDTDIEALLALTQ